MGNRRRIRAAIVVGALTAGSMLAGIEMAPPAQAACGDWTPSSGTVLGRHIPASPSRTYSEFIVRTTFTFTAAEVEALRCTGSRSFEVDVETYGGIQGGLKDWDSNLPGGYLDTEAFDNDTSRVLSVGSESAAAIRSGVEYFTEMRLYELGVESGREYAELYLNFQRGHWASSPDEKIFCGLNGGPENCIFGDESIQMKNDVGSAPRIEFQDYPVLRAGSWGSYRRSELTAGARINSGDQLYSPNGQYRLVMLPSGNLVEFGPDGAELWSSGTSTPESILIAHPDGNLVVVAPGNRPIWNSGVSSQGMVYQLQNDGNFVGYSSGHVARWSTGA